MIRWLEDNPIGQVLAAFAGVLALLMLVIGVIWSLPPSGDSGDEDAGDQALDIDIPMLPENRPIETYAVITERPVFNEDRQPDLGPDSDSMGDLPETVVDAPELELAGVVITPTLRMVTLRRKEEGESLVAFEGQPLEGNYGSWHVSRIGPRDITLASGEGEEMELALQVHDAEIAPPPKPEPTAVAAAESADSTSDQESGEPLTRAEEIRQRIAERREELRRAAEAAEQGEQLQSVDYQSAIQSMISGKKQKAQNEDER